MPDGKKKMISSKETGTVPKVKYWNNNAVVHQDANVANNLTSSMLANQERPQTDSRNSRQRCPNQNYHYFEGLCVDETRVAPNYNSSPFVNMSGGTTSPSTSGSTSRRHSGSAIRKCDNITKYPDKKQIEDKLNQIREYLKVTSTLMSSVKEDQSQTDENGELYQMLSALRDSEKKLETLLANKHVNENDQIPVQENARAIEIESPENGIPTLDTDHVIFSTLQNNVSCQRNDLEQKVEQSEKKLHALHEHQTLLMRLQEKAENQLKDARKAQEKLAAQANAANISQYQQILNHCPVELKNSEKNNHCFDRQQSTDVDIQSELSLLQSTNEGRGQLLRLLDARDNELCTEQHALQQKLQELNSKKEQIDQLVSQLHSYTGNGNGDTVSEDGDDMSIQIRQIVAMKEQLATLKDMLSAVKSTEASLLQQNSIERAEYSDQMSSAKSPNISKSCPITFSEADARSESERRWGSLGKQSNKSSIASSREQLQAELQAKKQELEELMYKDQDQTSAINQDVCSELVMNKAEQSFSIDSVPSSWTLLQDNSPPRESCISRENLYSSDEEELENYSQLNNTEEVGKVDYVNCNFVKQIPNRPVLNCNPPIHDTATASTPSVCQNINHVYSGGEHKQQLELMTNLCQSLLDQQRQIMPNQCSPSNFQWYSSYMQMQQALMLNTISQCCQLLWLQQQDINSLVSTVSVMQQQQHLQHHPKPQTLNVSPPTNESAGNASACSLPTRLPSNNTEYASLPPRERASPHNLTRNFPPNVMSQTHQWSGAPALNNQVAPGNRANNYWDNFRSYSRQNLLSTSTKSNEGSQNSLSMFDRSNTSSLCQMGSQRSQPVTLPKINMPIQESVSSMDLNNHDVQRDLSTSRASERTKPGKRNRGGSSRNRNEWSGETPQMDESPQKSKLFEVLRENVYKEVTLLISANENRPHFLIQLFRDLQLISSDPLRRSALQSIQSLISRSLSDSGISSSPSHCPSGLENCNSENRLPPIVHPPSATSTPSRNKPERSASRCCNQTSSAETIGNIKLELSAQFIVMDLMRFLQSHNEDVFNNGLVEIIKKMILDHCKSSTCNNKLQPKLDMIFNEMLAKYKGKRIIEIKEDLLKTIADILLEEMITNETIKDHQNISTDQQQPKPMENVTQNMPNLTNLQPPIQNNSNSLLFLTDHNYTLPLETFQFMQIDSKGRPNFNNVPRIDNGDLAEADQSRREAENEEGAVGGVLINHNDNQVVQQQTTNDLQSELDLYLNSDVNN